MATIGIDVTALATASSGGIGTSQYAIMRALDALGSEHRFIMYAASTPVVPFSGQPLDLEWPLRLGSGLAARSNIVWMQTGVNRLLAEDSVDVFWSPRHVLPFRAHAIATVATIQDFWHLHFPEQQPFLNRTANRVLIKRIARRADHLVATSACAADDATGFYGVSRDSVTVVPLGVDSTVFKTAAPGAVDDVLDRHDVGRSYVLAMDIFNLRKNFRAILEGVSRLPEALRSSLAIVALGQPRATATQYDPGAIAASLGIAHNLRILGDVALEDLIALYSGAAAFVYPSVYEGFGMPVLEAMACGCPVITSNVSSLPEVAGDAALLVSPSASDEIAAALRRLLTDSPERERLVRLGFERAGLFTWEKTARSMLEVFEQAYELKQQGRIRR